MESSSRSASATFVGRNDAGVGQKSGSERKKRRGKRASLTDRRKERESSYESFVTAKEEGHQMTDASREIFKWKNRRELKNYCKRDKGWTRRRFHLPPAFYIARSTEIEVGDRANATIDSHPITPKIKRGEWEEPETKISMPPHRSVISYAHNRKLDKNNRTM